MVLISFFIVSFIQSNPVLEAFGNAKTVRNNNSSRFGKFVEIQFDEKGRISGAAIRTYLLERSRVCQVSDPERNYHCFYMLCAAPQEDVKKFKLEEPKKYHYLNQSKCLELDSINDAEEYHATRRAMDVVGISTEEQVVITELHQSDFSQSCNIATVNGFYALLISCFRMLFSASWQPFSISGISNLLRGKRLIHRYPKMINPCFI
jgi:hypothetical protein